MHMETMMEWCWGCTWRICSSKFGVALGYHDCAILENFLEGVYLEAVDVKAVDLEAVDLEAVNLVAADLEVVEWAVQ